MSKFNIDYLLSAEAVRETTKKVYDLALAGKTHFSVDLSKLDNVTEYVLAVINDNYPDGNIPFHSRWGHFRAGGIDRSVELNKLIQNTDPIEAARVKLDLVITSVLLDAGAGDKWNYLEKLTGKSYSRSEGLGVASFHSFIAGDFSSAGSLVADSSGLKNYSVEKLTNSFQVTDLNPLEGLEGRAKLIQKLGEVVEDSKYFPLKRPGSIIDYLLRDNSKTICATEILQAVLYGLGAIWPSRLKEEGVDLGDVWHYPALGEYGPESLVCIHKLSQWLTYSLIEPIIEAGIQVDGVEKLTGLAEYRNGGLLVDSGLLTLRDESLLKDSHSPSSTLIIEWRALTVQLLDLIGEKVQKKLGKDASDFPLAKVLEGGTWWAGRKIAKENRGNLLPPISIKSDGTVF